MPWAKRLCIKTETKAKEKVLIMGISTEKSNITKATTVSLFSSSFCNRTDHTFGFKREYHISQILNLFMYGYHHDRGNETED